MPTITRVKPTLYKIENEGRFPFWHWHWLPELALQIMEWDPERVLKTFRDLTMDNGFGGPGPLYWADAEGNVSCSGQQTKNHVEPSHTSIYIPAGLGEDILLARSWGVVRLGREEYSGLYCPEGSLRSTHIGNGRKLAIVGFTGPKDYQLVRRPIDHKRRDHLPLLSGD